MTEIQSLSKQASKQASKQVTIIGCMDGFESTNRVYSVNGIAPTICTYCGGNQEAKILEVNKMEQYNIVATRGRNSDNPSDRTPGIKTEQRLEIQQDNICNTLTSIQKDNLLLEIRKEIGEKYHDFLYEIDGEIYLIRIRKLTPLECWRLMDFTDDDYNKAAKVNSQTQRYKQAGNSIVKNCLVAIFGQLILGKENVYKERMMKDVQCNCKQPSGESREIHCSKT